MSCFALHSILDERQFCRKPFCPGSVAPNVFAIVIDQQERIQAKGRASTNAGARTAEPAESKTTKGVPKIKPRRALFRPKRQVATAHNRSLSIATLSKTYCHRFTNSSSLTCRNLKIRYSCRILVFPNAVRALLCANCLADDRQQ